MGAAAFNPLDGAQDLETADIESDHAVAVAKMVHQTVTADDSKLEEFATKSNPAGLEARMYRALWIQGGAIVGILTALSAEVAAPAKDHGAAIGRLANAETIIAAAAGSGRPTRPIARGIHILLMRAEVIAAPGTPDMAPGRASMVT